MEETGKKARGRGRGGTRGRGRGKGRGRGRGRKAAAVVESEDEQMQEVLDESGATKSLDESMSSDKATSDEKPASPPPTVAVTESGCSEMATIATSPPTVVSPVDEKENELRPVLPPTIDMEADISQLEAPTFTTISRGPPEPMTRLKWDHKVNLIGEKVLNPMIHCCDQCENVKPILIYGRMIPCKHVFCLKCGREEPIKSCPRCKDKVVRVEQSGLGTVFMCTHGGSRYGTTGCRRTYLSQRDLQAHINHRHVALAASVEPKAAEQTRISTPGVRKSFGLGAGRDRSDSSHGSTIATTSSTHTPGATKKSRTPTISESLAGHPSSANKSATTTTTAAQYGSRSSAKSSNGYSTHYGHSSRQQHSDHHSDRSYNR